MCQDLVRPGIDELHIPYARASGEPLKGLEHCAVEVPGSLGTTHASLRPVVHSHDLVVLVMKREPGGPVASIQGFPRLAGDLHVLLRHRLRSISRRYRLVGPTIRSKLGLAGGLFRLEL